jgi:DNA-binding transcriptional MerR regulator
MLLPCGEESNKSDKGHRRYSPTQITTVKIIRVLSEMRVPLDTIKGLAKERSPEKVLKLLSKHRDLIEDNLRFLNEARSVIDTFVGLLSEGIRITETEFTISELPEKNIILGDVNDFSGSFSFFSEFVRFCAEPKIPKLNLSYPVGGYFDSMDVFLDEPSRPTRFFSLDPKGCQVKETGLYLTGYTRGYYGQTNDLPERMEAYAKSNGLVFSGPVYNIYLNDEISVTDPEQYLLQVSASVIETRRIPGRRMQLRF